MTITDIVNKIKERQEQIDKIIATFQTTMDNANKTMDAIQKTLNELNITVADIDHMVTTLQTDYDALKKRVDDITAPSKKHWPF